MKPSFFLFFLLSFIGFSQQTIDADPQAGQDTLIPHANVDEVKEFNASQRATTRVETQQEDLSEAFDL